MKLIFFLISAVLQLTIVSSFAHAADQPSPGYKKLYQIAERAANAAHPTDKTDQVALRSYLKVIDLLSTGHPDPPFLLKTYIATGAFLQVLDRNSAAIPYFKKAFELKKRYPALSDTVLFRPLVYCGNSYYRLDHPDSAENLYHKASLIAEKYPFISEVERLYNTLGVLAYATGNYNQSIVFYQKALNTLMSYPSVDKTLLVTFKSNLASAYRRLKRYDEALKLYQETLPYQIETDKVNHNIGALYLAMGQNSKAITSLKKVKYNDQKKFNDLAKAYLNSGDDVKAMSCLQQAEALSGRMGQSPQNSDHGITLKYLGDAWVQRDQPAKALQYYQQAIQNLLSDFKPTDSYTNPVKFGNAFNSMELLETLQAKAEAFRKQYLKSKNLRDLKAALQSYQVFYRLADYIQRFYETDESRLLISDRKYASRQQPIDLCLQLYSLTRDQKYIEQAFVLDEKNKAFTLSLYLEESKLKAKNNVPAAMLKEEGNLKERITRAALQASGEQNAGALAQLKRSVNENMIRLIAVQQKIGLMTGRKNAAEGDIEVTALQQMIPVGNAILSYHISPANVLCFMISKEKFEFFIQPLRPSFARELKELCRLAPYRTGNPSGTIHNLGQRLYQQLIAPAHQFLAGTSSLMIIPDDELNYLPFELLMDNKGNTVLDSYNITYNYSCKILQNGKAQKPGAGRTLGMAPFDQQAISKSAGTAEWQPLPSSRSEIEALKGTLWYGKEATKQNFINAASRYDVIHLATHAYADDKDPNQSFITFYPGKSASVLNYQLYLPEIYNLKLTKTRLIILSACETGSGALVKGEGLMSLSRAFSYAGCENIITSMWKADDAATAYISVRLHKYIDQGYGMSRALQLAKLDYLNDKNIPASKKLPGYWAHLRLIGDFESQPQTSYVKILPLLGLAVALVIASVFILKIRRRKRGRIFNV